MVTIAPFRGLRPRADLAADIASPPYDVINEAEARALAEPNPKSFLHVIRAEVDFPEGIDPHAEEVYQAGARRLIEMQQTGEMIQDAEPSLYIYRQQMGDHAQVGLVVCSAAEDYEQDRIKKHEFTRRDKEDDRAHHVDVLDANSGPVFLAYRAQKAIDALIAEGERRFPVTYDVTADGVRHQLIAIDDADWVSRAVAAFAQVPALYIADGHHRAAAAWRVAKLRRERNPDHTGSEEYNRFLTVVFPHDQLKILPYYRVARDLAGLDPRGFLARVAESFDVSLTEQAQPAAPGTFGMYLDGSWYQLVPHEELIDRDDPVKCLDVAVLQEHLLAAVLGIEDPRSDPRVDFVGGIRGTEELERRVAAGEAVAFALYPTTIEQLFDVADAGLTMPPKSTWFEPKLRSGLVVHLLS